MPKSCPFLLSLVLSLLLVVLPAPAAGWPGKVIAVAGGDTITVLHGQRQEKIRLYGIDCPEKCQAFGNEARRFTSHLVLRNIVDVHPVTCDRYGRTVAFVRIDNVLVNEMMIRNGLAQVNPRY